MHTLQLTASHRGLFHIENRVKEFLGALPQTQGTQAVVAPHHVTIGGSAVLATNNYCVATSRVVSDHKERRKGHSVFFYDDVPGMAAQAVKDFLSQLEVYHVYDMTICFSLDQENQFNMFTVLTAVFKLVEISEMEQYTVWMKDERSPENMVYRAMKSVYKKHGLDSSLLMPLWSSTVDKEVEYVTFPRFGEKHDDDDKSYKEEEKEEEEVKGVEKKNEWGFQEFERDIKIDTTYIWRKWKIFMVTTNLHEKETSTVRNVLKRAVAEDLFHALDEEIQDAEDYTIRLLAKTLSSHFLWRQETKSCGETENIVGSFYQLWAEDQMHHAAALSSNFNGSVLFLPEEASWAKHVDLIANKINELSDQNVVTVRFERLMPAIDATALEELSGDGYDDQYFIMYRFNKEEMENERAGQVLEVSDPGLGNPVEQEDEVEDDQQRGPKRKSSDELPSPQGDLKKPKSNVDSDGEKKEVEDRADKQIKLEVTETCVDQFEEQENLTAGELETVVKTEPM